MPLGPACWPQHPRPKKARAHPERDVQRAICDLFRMRYNIHFVHIDAGGAGWRSVESGGGRGHSGIPAGFPDLLGVIPPSGRAIYVEVKAPGGKPTPAQLHYLDMVRSRGAVAFWADSTDTAVARYLEAIND